MKLSLFLSPSPTGAFICPRCQTHLAYTGPLNAGLRMICPECLARAEAESDSGEKIDEALIFVILTETGAAWETVLGEPVCDKCGAGMERRWGKLGAFWGCPGWKKCKGGKPGPRVRVEERRATLELRVWEAYRPDEIDEGFEVSDKARRTWQARENRMTALAKKRRQKR